MQLEKLKIKNEDTSEEFSVLFNPTEYSLDDASEWTDQESMGQSPELQYAGGSRKKLTMDLFFDTYEARTDVREYTVKISNLLVFNSEVHRPPKVTISWGVAAPGGAHADFPFTGVLESLKQNFTMFLEDGTPVRAKLSTSFAQFTLSEDELKRNEPHSADKTKIYIVKEKDTVAHIASRFYNSPEKWRYIAKENQIEDPLNLIPGTRLVIPTYKI